jgi:predicted RNase H-like HicB family nuclease
MNHIADRYEYTVYWSDEDQCWLGKCPEFYNSGICHGDNPEAVLREIVRERVEIYQEMSRPLPEPRSLQHQAASTTTTEFRS